MNILFVGMRFNNYELKIKEEFEKQGHSVDLIYDKPKSYIVPAKFLSKNFIQKKNYEYQERNFKKLITEIMMLFLLLLEEIFQKAS